ncbi:hypothetical protein FRC17_006048 [Serendipita sp. 399]|nr:hypothetical protein FRC17_006048 [Serendipita sp. 399]
MTTVWEAASAAIQTLRNLGYTDVCFVGGVACALYGNPRTPHDLDILILNRYTDQESLKQSVCNADSSFFLVPSKKIGATYKVLWYRKSQYSYYRSSYFGSRYAGTNTTGAIKVDLLLPGIMDIPSFPSTSIDSSNGRGLPAAPLSVVLLLKLQAWSQHRAALSTYYRIEQYKDKSDLEYLAPYASGRGIRPMADLSLPTTFIANAQIRVREYLRYDPLSSTLPHWKKMGFEVPEPPAPPKVVGKQKINPQRTVSKQATPPGRVSSFKQSASSKQSTNPRRPTGQKQLIALEQPILPGKAKVLQQSAPTVTVTTLPRKAMDTSIAGDASLDDLTSSISSLKISTGRAAINVAYDSALCDQNIRDINRILEKDISSLKSSEAALAIVEDEFASCRQLFDIHDARRKSIVQEEESLTRFKDSIVARRANLANTGEGIWSKVGQALPDALFTKIDVSMTSLKSHFKICQDICDNTEQHLKHLRMEREQEQLVISTRKNTVALHRTHLASLNLIQATLIRQRPPQSRVSSEVWSNIFDYCTKATIDEYIANPGTKAMVCMPLRLAQVCSFWRQTIVGLPKLWTTVNLPFTISGKNAEQPLLHHLLSLSQLHAIKFVLNLGNIRLSNSGSPEVTCCIPALGRRLPRSHLYIITPMSCRRHNGQEPPDLTIKCDGIYVDDIVTHHRRQAGYRGRVLLPSTRHLNYLSFGSCAIAIPHTPLQALNIDIPSEYSLDYLISLLKNSLNSLQQLHIRSTFSSRNPGGEKMELPNLGALGLVLHPNVELHRIKAPNLKDLVLYNPMANKGLGERLDAIKILLAQVTIVTCVGWTQVGSVACEEIVRVVLKHGHRLKRLRFIDCSVSGLVLHSFMHNYPHVHFTLEYCRGVTRRQCEELGPLVNKFTVAV